MSPVPHRALLLDEVDSDTLRDHLLEATGLTDWLFSGLVDEQTFQLQPDPLRNPLLFYFGHPAAFYLNKLELAGLADGPLDRGFQQLFGVGVDPATIDELEVAPEWPPLEVVRSLRQQALERVLDQVDAVDGPLAWDQPRWALIMGVEHERIHFETSSVLIRQLPLDQVSPPQGWLTAPVENHLVESRPISLPGGPVHLGRPAQPAVYGWDNEYGALDVTVAPFAVSPTLVSNGEYLRFVEAGGYELPSCWSEAGWAWRVDTERAMPHFWRKRGEQLLLRTVFRELPLPLAWPAEVTWYEAEAYSRWAGARLPTEAEWAHVAQDAARVGGEASFHPDHHLNLAACTPRAVDAGTPSPRGVHDAVGNVWQWLADDFGPLPGFRTHRLYADFSTPYFDPDHKMLRGGAWASTGATASEHYRLWFRPYFLQHAGFRLAWDL